MSTIPLPSCTCLAEEVVIAFFVKDAVIMVLLKGEPLAVRVGIALLNAFLQGGNGIGVHNVTLTLESTVALPGWTSV